MQREYITTKERLEEVAVLALGPMTGDSYAGFMTQAQASGLDLPQLMLEWVFKRSTPMGYQAGAQVIYPISADEWEDFQNDIPLYCVAVPNVYVVDGLKYTAPI
jgi:hypothetical protein